MKASKITLENYEAFLLDYMEGNLSKTDAEALQQFIILHPELNIDLNELELIELEAADLTFENKNNLKKEISPLVSDDTYINYIENNLTKEEKKELEFLASKHTSVNKELNLYKSTILKPELNVVFENKNELKKEAKVLWLFSRQTLSMAAAVLLIVTFVFTFRLFNINNNGTQELSEVKVIKKDSNTAVQSDSNKENNTKEEIIVNSTEKIGQVNKAALANNTETKKNSSSKNNISNANTTAATETAITHPSVTVTENNNTTVATGNTTTVNSGNITLETNKATETKTKKAYIITEQAFDEDEKVLAANTEKKGLFEKARKAIKNLNKMGMKTLNATESVNGETEEYTLTMGNFTVYKNKFN